MHKIILIVLISITKCNAFFRHFKLAKLRLQGLEFQFFQNFINRCRSSESNPGSSSHLGKIFYNKLSTMFSHSHLIMDRHLAVQLISKDGVTWNKVKDCFPINIGDWEEIYFFSIPPLPLMYIHS